MQNATSNMFEKGPEYTSDSLHVSILNYLSSQYFRFWVCLWFSICHSLNISEICQVLNMPLWFRVLNMPQVLYMPGFWIYLGSQYLRVLNMPLVLNMPQLKYTRILTRILNLPGLHWGCKRGQQPWILINHYKVAKE